MTSQLWTLFDYILIMSDNISLFILFLVCNKERINNCLTVFVLLFQDAFMKGIYLFTLYVSDSFCIVFEKFKHVFSCKNVSVVWVLKTGFGHMPGCKEVQFSIKHKFFLMLTHIYKVIFIFILTGNTLWKRSQLLYKRIVVFNVICKCFLKRMKCCELCSK